MKDEMVSSLLRKMEAHGYKITKGTNTFTLANIVADFTSKIIDQRKHDLGALGFWGSDDLAIVVPILFARYRVYNTRHSPAKYQVDFIPKKTKMLSGVPGYPNLILIDDQLKIAAKAKISKHQIHNLSNESPTPLGIPYNDVFAGSQLTLKKTKFEESFMSQTGVYHERDYLILPDESGQAVFYPVTNFEEFGESAMTLTLLVREDSSVSLPELSPEVTITPDFLKFSLTQMMARFPIFQGISKNDLVMFIKEKYQFPVFLLPDMLFVDAPQTMIDEIKSFAGENLRHDDEIDLRKPGEAFVNIELALDETYSEKLRKVVAEKLPEMMKTSDVRRFVHRLVDEFYASEFLLDASYVKSQYPVKITITSSDEIVTKVEIVVV